MQVLTLALVALTTASLAYGQLSSCECGRNKLTTRIIGGKEATPNKFPWQVALVTSSGHQFCAGALINDR